MDDGIIILTTTGCSACETLKNSEITDKDGKVLKPEILNIQTSDDAVNLVLKHDVRDVPIAFQKKGEEIKKCTMKFDAEKNATIVNCEG